MPGGMLIPWEALIYIFYIKGPVTTDPKGKAPLFDCDEISAKGAIRRLLLTLNKSWSIIFRRKPKQRAASLGLACLGCMRSIKPGFLF